MKFREIINTHIIIWIWWAEIATLDDLIVTVRSRLPDTCRIHLRFYWGWGVKCERNQFQIIKIKTCLLSIFVLIAFFFVSILKKQSEPGKT
jgi:hypothetical protein